MANYFQKKSVFFGSLSRTLFIIAGVWLLSAAVCTFAAVSIYAPRPIFAAPSPTPQRGAGFSLVTGKIFQKKYLLEAFIYLQLFHKINTIKPCD
jgi:hypothetical protein